MSKPYTSISKDPRDHAVIPDPQIAPDTPISHLPAAGRFIAEYRPEVIVILADWYDMPSLSSYDMGKKKAEGRRYRQDIDAGNRGMDVFMNEVLRPAGYNPEIHFTTGNHEQRIMRHIEANPHLAGQIGYHDFNLDDYGIVQHDFLEIANIDGVRYSHYFANQFSGKPIGGSVDNKMNKLGFSFTMGHVQKLEFCRRDSHDGTVLQGLVAGAFYQHDEDYKGPQGNHHWRGICYKNQVQDGQYDLEVWSLDKLMESFGGVV